MSAPRALVIASDPYAQESLADALLEAGYDVDITDCQRTAARLAYWGKPRFVVVDADMPTLDEWFNDSEGSPLPMLGAPIIATSASRLRETLGRQSLIFKVRRLAFPGAAS